MDITGPLMNPISAGLRISPVYTAPQRAADSSIAIQAPPATTSGNVTLGQTRNDNDGYTYPSRSTATTASYALEQDAVDKLSLSLLTGMQGASLGERLRGVRAALDEQLALKGGASVSHSAVR